MTFAQSQAFQSNFQKFKDYAMTQASSSSLDERARIAHDCSESLNKTEHYQEAHQAALSQLDQVSEF